CQHYNTYPYGF
nr:immunoglobulin light chain junction region [Macaca mulatta]